MKNMMECLTKAEQWLGLALDSIREAHKAATDGARLIDVYRLICVIDGALNDTKRLISAVEGDDAEGGKE